MVVHFFPSHVTQCLTQKGRHMLFHNKKLTLKLVMPKALISKRDAYGGGLNY